MRRDVGWVLTDDSAPVAGTLALSDAPGFGYALSEDAFASRWPGGLADLVTIPLAGAFPMVVTPFTANGRVAVDEIAAVVAHQLAGGCPGVSALGLAGEASSSTSTSAPPWRAVLARCRPRARDHRLQHRRHVARTRACGRRASRGAAAIMLAAPGHLQGRGALLEHYETVARAIAPVPLDRAGRAGVPRRHARARVHRAVDGGVRPTSGMPSRRARPRSISWPSSPPCPACTCSGGNGGLHLPDELAAGAIGTIPGPEAPSAFQGIVDAWHVARTTRRAPCTPAAAAARRRVPGPRADVLLRQGAAGGLGLISSSHTRIAARPLSPLGRELLLDTARRCGLVDPCEPIPASRSPAADTLGCSLPRPPRTEAATACPRALRPRALSNPAASTRRPGTCCAQSRPKWRWLPACRLVLALAIAGFGPPGVDRARTSTCLDVRRGRLARLGQLLGTRAATS